jgi:DNA-binding CsgD family transcriptional regulator
VLVALAFFLYVQNIQNKKKLLETQHRAYQLKELARSFSHIESSFRNTLLEHFQIMKKVALLEEYLRDDEKKQGQHLIKIFNKIVYGQEKLDWDKLYQSMNDLNDGIFDRIKKQFPQLNETEFRICCLSLAQFSNNEISILLNYSVNTIQMKRTFIRKKLGIESHGNIRDFLIKKVEKNPSLKNIH